jgi:hypothetical protein
LFYKFNGTYSREELKTLSGVKNNLDGFDWSNWLSEALLHDLHETVLLKVN